MNVIIIGATSGIGKELARIYSEAGHSVGITGRRTEILASMGMPHRTMDVTHPDEACEALRSLIEEMGGADIVVISSGTGHTNEELNFAKERAAIDVNVLGFTAIADAAFHYFKERGRGSLVGITSVAGLFPGRFAPAYSASKAYCISYLSSLRAKARRECPGVNITDLRPGFIDTPLVEGNDNMFWVEKPEVAAAQMVRAISKHKRTAYITHRWTLIGIMLKLLPARVLERF